LAARANVLLLLRGGPVLLTRSSLCLAGASAEAAPAEAAPPASDSAAPSRAALSALSGAVGVQSASAGRSVPSPPASACATASPIPRRSATPDAQLLLSVDARGDPKRERESEGSRRAACVCNATSSRRRHRTAARPKPCRSCGSAAPRRRVQCLRARSTRYATTRRCAARARPARETAADRRVRRSCSRICLSWGSGRRT